MILIYIYIYELGIKAYVTSALRHWSSFMNSWTRTTMWTKVLLMVRVLGSLKGSISDKPKLGRIASTLHHLSLISLIQPLLITWKNSFSSLYFFSGFGPCYLQTMSSWYATQDLLQFLLTCSLKSMKFDTTSILSKRFARNLNVSLKMMSPIPAENTSRGNFTIM